MKGADGKHEFEGEVLAKTEKAVLFRGDYWDRPEHETGVWLSRKFCEVEYEPPLRGEPPRATVYVPDWLAKKAEIDQYD